MRTVRKGTFETNSSSCHSVTFECTRKEIDEFNEGKRFYFYNYKNGSVEALLTIEEIYEKIKPLITEEYLESLSIWNADDYEYDKYGFNGCGLPWKDISKETEKDFNRFKKYFLTNFDLDMLKFGLDPDYENPKYFSKRIIHDFIQFVMMGDGCPILSEATIRNCVTIEGDKSQVNVNKIKPAFDYIKDIYGENDKLRVYFEIYKG